MIIVLDKSTGDLDTALPLDPQRVPEEGDFVEITEGPKVVRRQYYARVAVVDLIKYSTSNEQITINGNPTEGIKSIYYATKGDVVTIVVDIVDSNGDKQAQIDGGSLGYPAMLMLPIVKSVNGESFNEEVYFDTSIVAGTMTASGTLEESGSWHLLTARVNSALDFIGADWCIDQPDIVFLTRQG